MHPRIVRDAYQVLGIPTTASIDEIRQAYRDLVALLFCVYWSAAHILIRHSSGIPIDISITRRTPRRFSSRHVVSIAPMRDLTVLLPR